jgi:hypothetical protein
MTRWWIKGAESLDRPKRAASDPEREGDSWPPPSESTVWVRREDLPYFVGIELIRAEDGSVRPVGVSVRIAAPHPFPLDVEVDLPLCPAETSGGCLLGPSWTQP